MSHSLPDHRVAESAHDRWLAMNEAIDPLFQMQMESVREPYEVGMHAQSVGKRKDVAAEQLESKLAAEAQARAQPTPYRKHDKPKAVEIGEIRQAKVTDIVGVDGKPYRLEAGRYAVVADETHDGRLQSAMIRYVVTDPASGERRAALSPVGDDRLRTLVRDGSIELHQGYALEQLGQRIDVKRLEVERDRCQEIEPRKVAMRR